MKWYLRSWSYAKLMSNTLLESSPRYHCA